MSLSIILLSVVAIVTPQTPVISEDSGHSHIFSSDHLLDNCTNCMCWNSGGENRTLPSWVVFDFVVPVKIDTFDWVNGNDTGWMVQTSYLQYYKAEYKTLKTISSPSVTHPAWVTNVINSTIYARYWKWYIFDTYNNASAYVCEVRFGVKTASTTTAPSVSLSVSSTESEELPFYATDDIIYVIVGIAACGCMGCVGCCIAKKNYSVTEPLERDANVQTKNATGYYF